MIEQNITINWIRTDASIETELILTQQGDQYYFTLWTLLELAELYKQLVIGDK